MNFKLWLEFEEVDPGNWNHLQSYCNINVLLPDGRSYGINVWTFNMLELLREKNKINGKNLNGIYECPPDLFVEELTRKCIEKVITDLLEKGDLEKLLNPSILSSSPTSRQ